MHTYTVQLIGGLQHGGWWILRNGKQHAGPFHRLAAATEQCDRENLRAAAKHLPVVCSNPDC